MAAPQDEALTRVEIVASVVPEHGQRHDVGVSVRPPGVAGGDQGTEDLAGARFAVTGPDHHPAGWAGQRCGTAVALWEELDQGLVRIPLHLANHASALRAYIATR